ncbi:glutaredoxin 3 [Xanthomonadaceae bacterium JHOS43]|jgi:glutaredoxin 3|nr:glutaredoxin 3 [Xanthomonadaceae bacterium JHOS43]MCX7563955.1 glutaredoxin 3 [Xanthomonadaceae bacterium XH05]
MSKVVMYTTRICPYCISAKQFLTRKGVTAVEEIRIDEDPERRVEMLQRAKRTSVPQIFIGDTHVGGFDDMVALDRAGGLDPLLAEA